MKKNVGTESNNEPKRFLKNGICGSVSAEVWGLIFRSIMSSYTVQMGWQLSELVYHWNLKYQFGNY